MKVYWVTGGPKLLSPMPGTRKPGTWPPEAEGIERNFFPGQVLGLPDLQTRLQALLGATHLEPSEPHSTGAASLGTKNAAASAHQLET